MASPTATGSGNFESGKLDLDQIKKLFSEASNAASRDVNGKITNLKNKPDDPALLAELQHSINKWTVTFNLSATTTRAIKDVMQSILQKI